MNDGRKDQRSTGEQTMTTEENAMHETIKTKEQNKRGALPNWKQTKKEKQNTPMKKQLKHQQYTQSAKTRDARVPRVRGPATYKAAPSNWR